MSGPKLYSTSNRYSSEVLGGKLNNLFKLQADLKIIIKELSNMSIHDSKLRIYFNCKKDLVQLQSAIKRCGERYTFSYSGSISAERFEVIDKEIELKIEHLQEVLFKCKKIREGFRQKENDYMAYLSYLNLYQKAAESFESYRMDVINSIEENLGVHSPEVLQYARNKLSLMNFDINKSAFQFNLTYEKEKENTRLHLIKLENDIGRVRNEINERILNECREFVSVNVRTSEPKNITDGEIEELIVQISELIINLEDRNKQKKYLDHLNALQNNKAMMDRFYFHDLYNIVYKAKKTELNRKRIKKILFELTSNLFHNMTESARLFLVSLCGNTLSKSIIRESEMDYIQSEYDNLKLHNIEYLEADEIKHSENLFLKDQIRICLQYLGYEVMEDMEVIDFGNSNEFLFKIPDQDNYLNLKFRNDGSFQYIFKVPESRDVLTVDLIAQRVNEMKITCEEFNEVINDLAKLGLKIQLTDEKPAAEDSIISIAQPEKTSISRYLENFGNSKKKIINSRGQS